MSTVLQAPQMLFTSLTGSLDKPSSSKITSAALADIYSRAGMSKDLSFPTYLSLQSHIVTIICHK